MPICPSGHESASDDFCDVCGIRIGEPTLSSVDAGVSLGAVSPGTGGSGRTINIEEAAPPECPRCGSPRDGQFCEACGWNFADGTGPEIPASWHGPGMSWHDPPAPEPAAPPVPPPAPEPAWDPPPTAPSSPAPPSPVPPSPAPSPLPPSSSRPGLRGPWFDTPAAPPAQPYEPPAPEPAPPPSEPAPPPSEPAPPPSEPAPPVPYEPPAPVAEPAAWSATVAADRDYFDAVLAASGMEAADIDFPAYCPDRHYRLSGSEMRIGRRSASRGITPEIDLTGPPSDPGVSRLHAVLIAGGDGTWSVLDPGSANGTLVNGSEIHPNEQVKLSEGDRINLGAWTVLIVSRDN